jgi:SAM-dependent methyltransferase
MDGAFLQPHERWQSERAARRYAHERWSSGRRRSRDPRLVGKILDAHLAPVRALVLDVPCGTGRLGDAIEARARYVGLDVSLPMLAAARASGRDALLSGDARRLPFQDGVFDAVVCCRLLHHLHEGEELERVLGELVRVTRGLVIASFWDAASLPEWRRRVLPEGRPPRRFARAKRVLERALVRAGASVVEWRHSARFLSRQTFVVARKRADAAQRDGVLARGSLPP